MKADTLAVLAGMMANPNLVDSFRNLEIEWESIVSLAKRITKEPQPTEGAMAAREAIQSFLEIGKRDLTNPKYDDYFESLRQALVQLNREQS